LIDIFPSLGTSQCIVWRLDAVQNAHAPNRFAHEIDAFLNSTFSPMVITIQTGGG
jgi:hypothetical protein